MTVKVEPCPVPLDLQLSSRSPAVKEVGRQSVDSRFEYHKMNAEAPAYVWETVPCVSLRGCQKAA